MLQVKIFANKKTLDGYRDRISAAIHQSVTQVLGAPVHSNHRFFSLEPYDFTSPDEPSENYLIIELTMLEGKPPEVKKQLLKSIFSRLEQSAAFSPRDVEIIINETPGHNWGILGRTADESAVIHKMGV